MKASVYIIPVDMPVFVVYYTMTLSVAYGISQSNKLIVIQHYHIEF